MNKPQFDYWQKQTPEKPLFPDIEWSKPQQKKLAGKLVIIGGNSSGFAAVAESYSQALKTGIGEVRVILPETLKKSIPSTITDAVFVKTNPSGGLAKEAKTQILASADWADSMLLIGDCGGNSETAVLYEKLLKESSTPTVITRDAIDLLRNQSNELVDRPNTLLILSFAQLQKLFQAVYYPKVLTFSMQLTSLVEALHKFTVTYSIGVVTFHNQQLLVAQNGEVSSTPLSNPMALWRGNLATRASIYWTWNPGQMFQAVSASAAS